MRTPTTKRFSIFLFAALLVSGGALAQCSEGQMQEAQIQFQNAQQMLSGQQWAQAIPQLESIVDFCPEYFPALRGLGLAHMKLQQYEEAAVAYERVIDVRGTNETDAADYANLAQALTKQKKYKEARAEYIKAKVRDAKNQAVLINLGILHYASGYPDEAVSTLEDALGYFPEQEANILPHLVKASNQAAKKHASLGNTAKASLYEAKAREYGGSAGGSSAYGQIQKHMQQRDYAGAVAACDVLLAKEPEHSNALLTKARAADALGRKGDSIDAYSKYLKLKPDNMEETSAMIIVMAEAGRCGESATSARAAMEKFAGTGQKALGKIRFAYGKALFCAEDFTGSKAQFVAASQSGDPKWSSAAREGIAACDEHLEYKAAQAKQAAQQGR